MSWWSPEVIGPPDCPILYRWTLLPWRGFGHSEWPFKLHVHRFLPNADDRDVHDHPRPFWTFVVWGYYDDMSPCPRCAGLYFGHYGCGLCEGNGVVLHERMKRGMLRRRPAVHRHRTRVGPQGCWTIVLMGPFQRDWGFWRGGVWWFHKNYEARFGYAMRCDDLDKEYRK